MIQKLCFNKYCHLPGVGPNADQNPTVEKQGARDYYFLGYLEIVGVWLNS